MMVVVVEGVLLVVCLVYIVYMHRRLSKRPKPKLATMEPSVIGLEFDRGNLFLDLPRKDINNINIDGDIIHIDANRVTIGFKYKGSVDVWYLETVLASFGYRIVSH